MASRALAAGRRAARLASAIRNSAFTDIHSYSLKFTRFGKKIATAYFFMFPHSFWSCISFGEFRSFPVVSGDFRTLFFENVLAYGHQRRNEETFQSANRWKIVISNWRLKISKKGQ